MKKFLLSVLVIVSCLILTGCGCEKKVTNYTVSFDSAGGTTVETITVKKGETIEKPTDPTKEGYIFKGWYTNLNNGDEFNFSKPITRNVTLIAKWEKITADDDNKKTDDKTKVKDDTTKEVKPVTKYIPVSKVNVSETEIVLGTSLTKKIEVSLEPTNATDKKVTWKSSNTDIATVKDGVITALKEGTTIITAQSGAKVVSINVKVVKLMDAALASIEPKTLTLGGTSINYEYQNCTITNTENVISDNIKNTKIEKGIITLLTKDTKEGTIKSTYKIVCGEETMEKNITHNVSASSYTYEAKNVTAYNTVIKVNDAKDYTLKNSIANNLKYNAKWDGVQTSTNVLKDKTFIMTFNNDKYTTYKVVEKNA